MIRINITIIIGALLAIVSAVLLIKNVLISYKLSDNGIKNFVWIVLIVACIICSITIVVQGLGAQSVYENAMNSQGYFRDMYYRHINIGTRATIAACVLFVLERIYFNRMKEYMNMKVKNRKDAWNLDEITNDMK